MIRAVLKACLPEFMNSVMLRLLGLMTVEPPQEAIESGEGRRRTVTAVDR